MNLSVYRREGEPGLCCAVPADEPVPAFVGGGPWRRDAAPLDTHAPPQGFDARAAGEALRSMGFYMFHGVVEPEPGSARQGAGRGLTGAARGLRPSRRPEPPEAGLESEAHVTRCGSTWR